MKAYDTSAKTLKTVLQNPLLQVSSIEDTMERMSDALADHKEIEDAIGLANEDAMAAAGVEPIDEKELQDELDALVQEQKAEVEKNKLQLEKNEIAKRERERDEAEAEEAREGVVKTITEEKQKQQVSILASQDEPTRTASTTSLSSTTKGDASLDSQSASWGRQYEAARAEKAAQAIRDREAELRIRDRWDKRDQEAVKEA